MRYVLACAVGGWRPNKTAGEEMAVQVEAALQRLTEDDIIVVHCFDNIAFMARSEEGVICPSGDIRMASFTWRAIWHWQEKLVFICFSETVSHFCAFWREGSWCS